DTAELDLAGVFFDQQPLQAAAVLEVDDVEFPVVGGAGRAGGEEEQGQADANGCGNRVFPRHRGVHPGVLDKWPPGESAAAQPGHLALLYPGTRGLPTGPTPGEYPCG